MSPTDILLIAVLLVSWAAAIATEVLFLRSVPIRLWFAARGTSAAVLYILASAGIEVGILLLWAVWVNSIYPSLMR